MNDGKYVISKKTIIIYLIISLIYLVISYMWKAEFMGAIVFELFFALPAIIALIINFTVKKFKIQNEKGIKITRIIYNIFTVIYLILMGFIAGIFYYLKDLDLGQ